MANKFFKPLRGIQLNKTHPRAKGLVGRWVFNQNSGLILPDYSGFGNDGIISGATWTPGDRGPTLQFDGIDDIVNCGNKSSLNFGTGNFTIIARVKTAAILTDVIGDIVSKFDASAKKGYNLTILQNNGVSQSNFRQVVFSIDDNHPNNIWRNMVSRFGAETSINALVVYNGKLYGGTAPGGKLAEWDGAFGWIERAPQLGIEAIASLAVYNNKIYAGTYPGGRLFEWNGIDAWIEKAPQLSAETRISALAVYNGKLYGGTVPNGKLYEWNGVDAWIEKAPRLYDLTYIMSLAVYNGKLYAGTYYGFLFEWNGVDAWIEKAPVLGSTYQIFSLAVYNGKLYGGTGWSGGKLFEWNGTDAWVEKAPQAGTESRMYSLAVYNGKLYGGSNPTAKLYEWNGVDAWVERAPQLGTTTTVWCLAVYNGKLYAGIEGGIYFGRLYEWNTGRVVSYDYELNYGWREIAAVRDTNVLKLYVDGVLVNTSESFTAVDYDLSNAINLLIGFGQQDYFNGLIDDISIYNRVLSADEIKNIHESAYSEFEYMDGWLPASTSGADVKTATCTIDGYIASLATCTIDAHIAERKTSTFTNDAIIRETKISTFTFDTYIAERKTSTFTIDTHIAERKTASVTIDTHIAERKTASVTIDTHIAERKTSTFTLDTYIATLATCTIDAYIASLATCTIDAYIAGKAIVTLDAEIQGEGIRFLYQVIEEQIPGIYTIALSKTTAGPPISKAIWIPPSNIQFYLALSYDGTNFSQDIEIMPHTPYRLSGVARAVRITIP